MPKLVYSPRYNIGFYGLERLHPFDSRKYGKAWKMLRQKFGSRLKPLWIKTDRPTNREELLLVHSEAYLQAMRYPKVVASALEVPAVSFLPGWAIDWHVLRPMRWATRGTILAAKSALTDGLAINLGGGYHHAKPEQGEGFCIYADVGIAVAALRAENLLGAEDRIVYIDTDAHQGNGICHTFMKDNRFFILDMFNAEIYPLQDQAARDRIDCPIPLDSYCSDAAYLRELSEWLPPFLDSVGKSRIGLAIYNAGTDIFGGDPLGDMNISGATILERDLYVVGELRKRNIPTMMVLSGGYTKQSFQLVADSVTGLIEQEAS